MSTIKAIGEALTDLQGRVLADRTSIIEAKAMLEAEHRETVAALTRRHEKLMAFLDGQIAAKDEAIDGETDTMPPVEFKQAAE